jgi:putative ABC transport system substrate-binding protein
MKSSFFKLLGITAIFLFSLTRSDCAYAVKIYRILVIDSQRTYPYDGARDAMIRQLASFGYVEGKNLFIKRYSLGNDADKGEKILRQELGKNYDVIFVNGTVATMAAKKVAWGESLHRFIFAAVTDPVGIGIIDDFTAPPKANFTGVCYPVPVNSRLKFIRDMFPKAKTIGLIYSDMPQGHSYRKWVETALKEDPQFKDLQVIFRMVPLIKGETSSLQMMSELAQKYIVEIDPQVDLFLSPNDQLATARYFSEMVYKTATKPLVGISRNDVMEGWGATMSIYPSELSAGRQSAFMIKKLLEGEDIKNILPQWPKENGIAFDLRKAKHFGIKIPVKMMELAGDDIVR